MITTHIRGLITLLITLRPLNQGIECRGSELRGLVFLGFRVLGSWGSGV